MLINARLWVCYKFNLNENEDLISSWKQYIKKSFNYKDIKETYETIIKNYKN